jgi:DNA-binding winged helix-turn-helix (wHTH) protein
MNKPVNHFYEFGPFRLDPLKRVFLRDGKSVSLTPKVFDTLLVLVEHSGQVVEKEKLMKAVWPDSIVEEGNLTVSISTLRKALGEKPNEPQYIVTVPGRGYQFAAVVKEVWVEDADQIEPAHTRLQAVMEEEARDGGQAEEQEGRGAREQEGGGAREPEYVMSRGLARWLFVALQGVYLTMYVAALRWSEPMYYGLEHVLGWKIGYYLSAFFIVSAIIGIAIRLYLVSVVVFDHVRTGVHYRCLFPLLFPFDMCWSVIPLALSRHIGGVFSLVCLPPLVFSPFSQRTLIRSAYDMHAPRRTSTQPGK